MGRPETFLNLPALRQTDSIILRREQRTAHPLDHETKRHKKQRKWQAETK